MLKALLHELRYCFRRAVLAGTKVLVGDVRLKRAAEKMKKYKTLSPVLAKLSDLTEQLVAPGEEGQGELLADAISLLDAVLCTQAEVSVEGELMPLSGDAGEQSGYSYTEIKKLYAAFTSSWKNQYRYVLQVHNETPEIFKDNRIRRAMVMNLVGNKNHLALWARDWLEEDNAELLPILQEDFNPNGTKEMIARVEIMEEVAGGAANEFYVRTLSEANGRVKKALIHALRHSPDNVELLLELAKTEKANLRPEIYSSLAALEDERAEQFIKELYKSKPLEAMAACQGSYTSWASVFVADCLMEQLKLCNEPDYGKGKRLFSTEQVLLLLETLQALPGKGGEKICMALRMAADVENIYFQEEKNRKNWRDACELKFLEKEKKMRFTYSFPHRVATMLEWMIYKNPAMELCQLAEELFERDLKYFRAAWLGRLLNEEDAVAWLENRLFLEGEEGKIKNEEMEECAKAALDKFILHKGEGEYYIENPEGYERESRRERIRHRITQKLMKEIMDVLKAYKDDVVDGKLQQLLNEENAEVKKGA